MLTFDISDPKKRNELTADVIVSADTAVKNSKIYYTTPAYELKLYVIHGLLHLLGYDDRLPRQTRLMRKKEKEYADT